MERAPEISRWLSVAPTRAYCAPMRLAGSGMNEGEISPTDVESPRWTTALHDVVVGAAGAAAGTVLPAGPGAGVVEAVAAVAGTAVAGAAVAGVAVVPGEAVVAAAAVTAAPGVVVIAPGVAPAPPESP